MTPAQADVINLSSFEPLPREVTTATGLQRDKHARDLFVPAILQDVHDPASEKNLQKIRKLSEGRLGLVHCR